MTTEKSGLAQQIAESYAAHFDRRLRPVNGPIAQKIDESFLRSLAIDYHNARHAPSDPVVQDHYQALIRETHRQFEFARDEGRIRFTLAQDVPFERQPYSSMPELFEDVERNRHIAVWVHGHFPVDHPLWQPCTLPGLGEWREIFVLRAVHELYGHATGQTFLTHLGEEQAYHVHASLYTSAAWPALTSEFRAHLAWLNFGPHMRRVKSAPDRHWSERPYPIQKAIALRRRFWQNPFRGTGVRTPVGAQRKS